jgi:xylulokinase
MALLFGYDIGSSSIKATLMEAESGKVLASATVPDREMEIIAKKPGWAEQHPQTWWDNVVTATQKIKAQTNFAASDVRAIGISYQMHGLVIVDAKHEALRPAIIWCDSRAVEIGRKAMKSIGAGLYRDAKDAFAGLKPVNKIEPNKKLTAAYENAYKKWFGILKQQLQ